MMELIVVMVLGAVLCLVCVMAGWKYTKKCSEDYDDMVLRILFGTGAVMQMVMFFMALKSLVVTPMYCYQMEQMGAREDAQVYQEIMAQEDKSEWVNWTIVEEYFEEDD